MKRRDILRVAALAPIASIAACASSPERSVPPRALLRDEAPVVVVLVRVPSAAPTGAEAAAARESMGRFGEQVGLGALVGIGYSLPSFGLSLLLLPLSVVDGAKKALECDRHLEGFEAALAALATTLPAVAPVFVQAFDEALREETVDGMPSPLFALAQDEASVPAVARAAGGSVAIVVGPVRLEPIAQRLQSHDAACGPGIAAAVSIRAVRLADGRTLHEQSRRHELVWFDDAAALRGWASDAARVEISMRALAVGIARDARWLL